MARGSDKKVSKKEGMTRREFVKRATYELIFPIP